MENIEKLEKKEKLEKTEKLEKAKTLSIVGADRAQWAGDALFEKKKC